MDLDDEQKRLDLNQFQQETGSSDQYATERIYVGETSPFFVKFLLAQFKGESWQPPPWLATPLHLRNATFSILFTNHILKS